MPVAPHVGGFELALQRRRLLQGQLHPGIAPVGAFAYRQAKLPVPQRILHSVGRGAAARNRRVEAGQDGGFRYVVRAADPVRLEGILPNDRWIGIHPNVPEHPFTPALVVYTSSIS